METCQLCGRKIINPKDKERGRVLLYERPCHADCVHEGHVMKKALWHAQYQLGNFRRKNRVATQKT